MASCAANWRETDPTQYDTIHADFTWADAVWNFPGELYCSMAIYDPTGTLKAHYVEENDAAGSHTLQVVADITGQWECLIKVWNGSSWVTCADYVNIALQCPDYTNQTDCEAAGCYWWHNSCHTSPPSCEQLNNEPDCLAYGCYWYNNSCYTNPQGEWTLGEALTCLWVEGYNDHGRRVTEFDIGEDVYAYIEVHGPDMYGKTVRHEWWYKEVGASVFTKRWEYEATCGGHYTEWATWTWWNIGGAYGPGEGYIGVYLDNVFLGKTNNYTIIGAIGTISPQSEYYTGPFAPGDVEYIMRVFYGNRSDAGDGTIYYNLYEYPNTTSENLLQANQRTMYPGQSETWYQSWIIPDVPSPWSLGIKVWGDGEEEPTWGSMGTKIFKMRRS